MAHDQRVRPYSQSLIENGITRKSLLIDGRLIATARTAEEQLRKPRNNKESIVYRKIVSSWHRVKGETRRMPKTTLSRRFLKMLEASYHLALNVGSQCVVVALEKRHSHERSVVRRARTREKRRAFVHMCVACAPRAEEELNDTVSHSAQECGCDKMQ